jgi:hypothetical protein
MTDLAVQDNISTTGNNLSRPSTGRWVGAGPTVSTHILSHRSAQVQILAPSVVQQRPGNECTPNCKCGRAYRRTPTKSNTTPITTLRLPDPRLRAAGKAHLVGAVDSKGELLALVIGLGVQADAVGGFAGFGDGFGEGDGEEGGEKEGMELHCGVW